MTPRVFIAEDNDQFAALVEKLLRRLGVETERAADGPAALDRILAAPPDALLLDLRLPGLSGIDLLRRLRGEPATRALPVIVMTGVFRGEPYARAARALGVEFYLEKPFGADVLVQALRRSLPRRPGSRPQEVAVTETIQPSSPIPGCDSSPLPLAAHLLRARQKRFTGVYRLRNSAGQWNLLLADGLPAALEPGFACRDLGDYLHRRGLISAEEYGYYRHGQNGRSDALVQMGCLDHRQLLQERLDYLEEELAGAFGLPPMSVEELPVSLPPDLQPLTVNLAEVIYLGMRRFPAAESEQELLRAFGRQYVAITPAYFQLANFLPLRPEETVLLQSLDGSRTLAECLGEDRSRAAFVRFLQGAEMVRFGGRPLAPPAAPDFPLRTLFNAVAAEAAPGTGEAEEVAEEALESFADLVEEAGQTPGPPGREEAPPTPSPAAAPDPLGQKVREQRRRLEGKNYYEIFGLSQGRFSFDLLKQRYFQLTREFGPDVLMQLSGPDAAHVEEILSTVTAAYNTLSDVVKKERYDELLGSDRIGLGQKGDERFQAQVQFQSAKVFMEMEEWESAEKALQDACNIEPNNGLYLAHLAWALYRNPAHADSRAILDKARQMLNRALTLERTAEGFAFKGRMLFDAGQDALAELEFGKALRLDARQSLARTGLRQLQEKRELEKKGLLRRFFR